MSTFQLFQNMVIWGGGIALLITMIGVIILPIGVRVTLFITWIFYGMMIIGIFGVIFVS